jgi:hypothetical protein
MPTLAIGPSRMCDHHRSGASIPPITSSYCSTHLLSLYIRKEFERIVESISDGLDFSQTIGLDAGKEGAAYENGGGKGVLGEVDFYIRFVWLTISFCFLSYRFSKEADPVLFLIPLKPRGSSP